MLTREEAAAVLARLHEAQGRFYAGGDRRPLEDILAEDVVWHVPGSSPIAGTYRGIDEVLAYMAHRRDLAERTFTLHPGDLLVGERYVASLTDGEVRVGGEARRWSTVGLYRIAAGKVAECHLIPFDQDEFDAIWAAGPSADQDPSLTS